MKFEIKDFELDGRKTKVTAPGIVEAMYEYLPWPSLDLKIFGRPSHGFYEVIDLKTEFKYEVFVG